MKRKSAVIDAQCGDRLIFGLVNPDEDALYQLQYGFMPPDGQMVTDVVWQNVRVNGKEVLLYTNNYPLVYNVYASGKYRLVNMAGDNTSALPVLIEQYSVNNYLVKEKAI